jgi:hypothetical protein
MSELTFSASFLNPSVVQNLNQDKVMLNLLFPGIEEFDIRKNCTNNIFEAVSITHPKQMKSSLLAQYQNDDYLFDVYQVLDPFELTIKV